MSKAWGRGRVVQAAWTVAGALVVAMLVGVPAPARALSFVAALPSDETAVVDAGREAMRAFGALPGEGRSQAHREPPATVQAARDLLAGRIDAALLPMQAFVRQSALFRADQIPFLASDPTALDRLVAVLRPRLADRLAEEGLVLVAVLPMRPVGYWRARHRPDVLPGALPGALAVTDAMSRRLGERAGARRVEVPPGTATRAIAAGTASAGFERLPPPEQARRAAAADAAAAGLVSIAYWPLALFVMQDGIAANFPADQLARARDMAETHARQMAASAVADSMLAASPPLGQWRLLPRLAAAPARVREARAPAPPTVRDALAEAAMLDGAAQVAREWAVDAGADGHAIMRALLGVTDAGPERQRTAE